MSSEFKTDRPIYIQLVEEIQLRIISGLYAPGEKLPPVREMASVASVNPNTMQRALAELERQELVFPQRTNGRYITEDQEKILWVKHTFATAQISDFLNKMEQLGFTKTETIAMMQSKEEGVSV